VGLQDHSPRPRTPDQEDATLDQWAREQDTKPYLRYSTEGAAATDPGDGNTEAVGDMDAVAATRLGLKNLTAVSAFMFKGTTTKVGDPYDDLETIYGRMATQWSNELGHVVKLIGGLESQQVHIGQQGMRFKTVPKAKQIEALQFVLANAFPVQPPPFMVNTDILRRIQPVGAVDRVRTAQNAVLTALLQNARLDRMTEQVAIDGRGSRLRAGAVPGGRARRCLVRAWQARRADLDLPPQPAAVVPGQPRSETERHAGFERGDPHAGQGRTARAGQAAANGSGRARPRGKHPPSSARFQG
jgi:hypothetical protein